MGQAGQDGWQSINLNMRSPPVMHVDYINDSFPVADFAGVNRGWRLPLPAGIPARIESLSVAQYLDRILFLPPEERTGEEPRREVMDIRAISTPLASFLSPAFRGMNEDLLRNADDGWRSSDEASAPSASRRGETNSPPESSDDEPPPLVDAAPSPIYNAWALHVGGYAAGDPRPAA